MSGTSTEVPSPRRGRLGGNPAEKSWAQAQEQNAQAALGTEAGGAWCQRASRQA